MDMKKYMLIGSGREAIPTIRLGRSYTQPHRPSYWSGSHGNKKPTVWQVLLRKLRFRRDNNKKKKLLNSCGEMEGIYNPQTYSLNFDQGLGRMEPDNLCRSFSARFAIPTRIFPPTHLLDS